MTTRLHHVVEIGAGDAASSALSWCTHAERVTLWEPNRLLWADLMRGAQGLPNVTVRPEAVSDMGGTGLLYHLGLASYLAGEPSFFATSIEPEGVAFLKPLAREVPVVTVNQAVTRDVDLLILTIGGGEGRLLRAMSARPAVIETKHYCHRPEHWAVAQEVFNWMHVERYVGHALARNEHATFLHVRWERA